MLLILIQTVSLVYAVNLSKGIGPIGLLVTFFSLINYGYHRYDTLIPSLRKYYPVVLALFLVQVLLIFVFYFSPALEGSFWRSGAAQVLMNQRIAKGGDMFSNLLEEARSGGTLVTGQLAAILIWLGAVGCMIGYLRRNDWKYLLLTILFSGAIAATGTKSIMLIWILLLIGGIAFLAGTRRKFALAAAGALIIMLPIYYLPRIEYTSTEANQDQIPHEGQINYHGGNRKHLWRLAAHAIKENPLRGVGFGGWDKYYEAEKGEWAAEFGDFIPTPHNVYLLIWLRSGFAAFLVLCAAACITGVRTLYCWRRRDPAWLVLLGGACCGLVAIGIVEDNPFWGGSEYLIPLSAFIFVVLFKFSKQAKHEDCSAILPE